MNVFEVHRRIIDDYARYIRSFIRIDDAEIRQTVDNELREGKLWPEPLLQFDLPPSNVTTFRERISGGATQGRATDATRKEVHGGADHREAPRG